MKNCRCTTHWLISTQVGDFNLPLRGRQPSMDWFAEDCRAKGDLNVHQPTQWGALATEGGMALENTRKLMDQRGHGVVSPEQMVDLMEIVIHQLLICLPWSCVLRSIWTSARRQARAR